MLAPARSRSSLGLYLLGCDVDSGLGFHHEYGRYRFRHEVRDVLRLLTAQLVVNLELTLGRLEPFRRVALKNDCEAPLRV
jgi:hypothetical protein